MRLLLLLLVVAACGQAPQEPTAAFYCDADSCALACKDGQSCHIQRTAACAWLISGSTFLCYPTLEQCTETAKLLRLRSCAIKTPTDMLPR